MNIDNLLNRFQLRYKKTYTKEQSEDIKNWFDRENIDDNFFDKVYDMIVDTTAWLPQRKDFNDIKLRSGEARAEKIWQELVKIKAIRSVFCSDKIAQQTILNMGGIDIFFEEMDKSNQWCHKIFIERYMNILRSGIARDTRPEVLYCRHDKMYNRTHDIVCIGNQARAMLENLKTEQIEDKGFKIKLKEIT